MLRLLFLPALSLSIGLALAAVTAGAADNALRDQVAELFKQRQWAEARTLLEKTTARLVRLADVLMRRVYLSSGDRPNPRDLHRLRAKILASHAC